jgi:hypothetical protein
MKQPLGLGPLVRNLGKYYDFIGGEGGRQNILVQKQFCRKYGIPSFVLTSWLLLMEKLIHTRYYISAEIEGKH